MLLLKWQKQIFNHSLLIGHISTIITRFLFKTFLILFEIVFMGGTYNGCF
jgi:hypothetical protein